MQQQTVPECMVPPKFKRLSYEPKRRNSAHLDFVRKHHLEPTLRRYYMSLTEALAIHHIDHPNTNIDPLVWEKSEDEQHNENNTGEYINHRIWKEAVGGYSTEGQVERICPHWCHGGDPQKENNMQRRFDRFSNIL